MAIKLYEDCGVLAIWQTFAARIQNHPKVGGSLVLLETRERVAKVSTKFPRLYSREFQLYHMQ